MQTYAALHEVFPSKKLVRKMFPPRQKPNAVCVVLMRTFVQHAVLAQIESNPLVRQVLTRNGDCILHRFVDSENKVREFTFDTERQRRRAARRLAKELCKIAREGIDVEGYGSIVLEDGDVVFVPCPVVPRYGNVLLFDPYFRVSKG